LRSPVPVMVTQADERTLGRDVARAHAANSRSSDREKASALVVLSCVRLSVSPVVCFVGWLHSSLVG
jgi:hypothetical protein